MGESEPIRRGPGPALGVAALAILALYLAISAFVFYRSIVLQPYADMFDWLDRHFLLEAGQAGWADVLLEPHNSHRLLWTMLVLEADIRLFGGGGYLFAAVGAGCLAAMAVILAREARAAADGGVATASAAAVAMISLASPNIFDASIHLTTSYVHCALFAVLSLVLAERGGVRTPIDAARFGALVCYAAAALGNTVGLAVWPVLMIGALRRRASPAWLAILAAAGLVFTWAYVSGQAFPDTGLQGLGGEGALRAAKLFLSYLGLPWARAVPSLGWIIGLILLIASLAALTRRGGPQAPVGDRLAASLILFSLGSALMAAIGRTGATEPWNVPIRYAIFLTPMHVGLFMLAVRALQVRAPRSAGPVAIVAVLLALTLHQAISGLFVVKTTDALRARIGELRPGVSDPEVLIVFPDPARALAAQERLRREGLYQAEWRPWRSRLETCLQLGVRAPLAAKATNFRLAGPPENCSRP